ncbi:MFS transporter [Bradyrhizobium sp.]|jgi:MFS family permease|uniref:MFS transporter n=1 Tax=Bradyrhizobium sp. TaxID=376 RepID=UPI002B59306E|nr:MFS transporter [Bradyrhizobium sp.]HWX64574.1 MFS transporter [Bradyrhizobium sp.]
MLARLLNNLDAGQPLESLQALDWLNFFLAALLVGFGPFVAVHLAENGWAPASIGAILTISGLAGLMTQVPAGELIDVIASKRALFGAAAATLALALTIFGLRSDFPTVAAVAIMQGGVGSVLGPSIAAISLGLVGHDALAVRLGRNQRFASIGGLAAAAIMGAIGYLLSTRDIFLVAAALAIPLLLALLRIRGVDIHFGRSCGAPDHHAMKPDRASRLTLFKDVRFLAFLTCLLLFQLANASILPQVSQSLVHSEGRLSSLAVSALIVVPQIVVAAISPWVGRTAATWGRRPLLLLGLAIVPIRSGLSALTADPVLLVVFQLMDGFTGATLGVLTTLIIADLTNGTGRFNLAQGLAGTFSGVGASLSTLITGVVTQRYGYTAGLLGVTAVGLMAVVVVLEFMPETKPALPRPLGAPTSDQEQLRPGQVGF